MIELRIWCGAEARVMNFSFSPFFFRMEIHAIISAI